MIRIRTFGDQDAGRIAVSDLSARAVCDILYLLDTATGPDGPDAIDSPPDPETSRLYKEFRDWFGPQVGAAIQGLVVGPLLSRLSVDEHGRCHIAEESYRAFLPDDQRLASRIRWLCEEIPSLADTYGQLSQEEKAKAVDCVYAAQGLDLNDPQQAQLAQELLPALERWFIWANPGAKILRGDKETIKALLDGLDGVRERVAVLEAERADARQKVEQGNATKVDSESLNHLLEQTEYQIARYERKLGELDKERDRIVEALSALV